MLNKLVSIMIAGLFVSGTLAGIAKGEDVGELKRQFDAYNLAAKAGKVDTMLDLLTAERKGEVRKEVVKSDDRRYFLLIARGQTPESYEVQHTSFNKNGRSAKLYLLGQFPAMPEIERPRVRMELMISYKKENGAWKLDSILPLGDPDKVKRTQDLSCDPKDADMHTSQEIGGRIIRTEFKDDYTLVLLRVMDEEYVVCLARKEILQKAGLALDELDAWNIHEFSGHPHLHDKLKFFATGGRLIEDE